jgi:hypothetical protein
MPPKSKFQKSREGNLLRARSSLDVGSFGNNCLEVSEHEQLPEILQTKPPASMPKGYETDVSTQGIYQHLEKAIAHGNEHGFSEDVVEVKSRRRHRSESKLRSLENLETGNLTDMYHSIQRRGSKMFTTEVR